MTTIQAAFPQKQTTMIRQILKAAKALIEPVDSTGAGSAMEYGKVFGVAKIGFWYAMSFLLTSLIVGLN